ncbi:amino acid ABC transporter permease [Hylemonella sp. W303a]|uniref:amino acid ABC transporter permease n=1 Tax=Hylemonella sp. W303a TaxID=3389873 RepID=UPI00396B416D
MSETHTGLVFTFLNPEVAARYWLQILHGLGVTVAVGLAVVLTGLLLGLGLAVLRALHWRALSLLVVAYADVMRSLPPLILLIVVYFGFPSLGLPLSAFATTWLALSLVLAAYAEESIWAGMVSLPEGQMDAARSTGLRWWQAMRWVVLPQALRRAVPPLTNRVISITKNTALGSVVALSEILNQAQAASSTSGNPTPLTLGALAYLVVFLPVVALARWIERRGKSH